MTFVMFDFYLVQQYFTILTLKFRAILKTEYRYDN